MLSTSPIHYKGKDLDDLDDLDDSGDSGIHQYERAKAEGEKAYLASSRHTNAEKWSNCKTAWSSRRIYGAQRRISKMLIDRFAKDEDSVLDVGEMPCNPKGFKPHQAHYLKHYGEKATRKEKNERRWGRSRRYAKQQASKPWYQISAMEALGSLGPTLEKLEQLAIYKIVRLKAFETKTFFKGHPPLRFNAAIDPLVYDAWQKASRLAALKKERFADSAPRPTPIEALFQTTTKDKTDPQGYVAYIGTARWTYVLSDPKEKWLSDFTPYLAIHYHLSPSLSKRYFVGSSSGMVLKIFGTDRKKMMEEISDSLGITSEEGKDGKADVHYGKKRTEGVASVVGDEEPIGYHKGRIFMGDGGKVVEEWSGV